jgi:ferrochelatase
LLLVSFGGPEGADEVLPFLENVLRGRNVPRERMLEVAEHYYHFGGASPINEQNRRLIAAIQADFAAHALDLPIYWGNRNWHPLLPDALRQMAQDGVRRAAAFVTSAFSSYSGCRQYRENLLAAQEATGAGAPQIDKLRAYYNHPGFIEAMVDRVREARGQFASSAVRVVYTAHSIPLAMAQTSHYERQLTEACRLVSEAAGVENWRLAYQSRSGPPSQPWLEPDIGDLLREMAARGVRQVVMAPIGFISDHLEVLYDLDTEAQAIANDLGMEMVRAGTVGLHPQFVSMVRELVLERQENRPARRAAGNLGPSHDVCPADCCPAPLPAPRPNPPAAS